jgi:hypothetical protein
MPVMLFSITSGQSVELEKGNLTSSSTDNDGTIGYGLA